MIIHMSRNATQQQLQAVKDCIANRELAFDISNGKTGVTVIGVLGDCSKVEESVFEEIDGVDKVVKISKPYKLVSREFAPANRVIKSGSMDIGGKSLVMIAGPCSLENDNQIMTIANYISDLQIPVMRGGAYKPRTSPYSFQGMGFTGLQYLVHAREKYGFQIVTEATGLHNHENEDGSIESNTVLDNVVKYTDIVQIGARNMKSYGFLREVAIKTKESKKPVLLKRGESSTLKDFLLAAEYIAANGNSNVILCLRGIRTFEEEKFQRYTPDLGAIPVLKRESNLPVFFDPSHSTGYRSNVYSVSMAAVAAGADGLIIETHNDPSTALCDGEQSVTQQQLSEIIRDAAKIRSTLYPDGYRFPTGVVCN
jgi:3-deoxy-7-phosphoheptulonate synthase